MLLSKNAQAWKAEPYVCTDCWVSAARGGGGGKRTGFVRIHGKD